MGLEAVADSQGETIRWQTAALILCTMLWLQCIGMKKPREENIAHRLLGEIIFSLWFISGLLCMQFTVCLTK